MTRTKALGSLFLGLVTVTAVAKHDNPIGATVCNANGELIQPVPQVFRKWVFVGAPLTPSKLNDGKTGFPEYLHVYINPDDFSVYKQTGEFPEGKVIDKELVLLKKTDYVDGSSNAPSGRGYFAGQYNGMDVMVKDCRRFQETNGWESFNFGHHAPPYTVSAKAVPASSCAGCHEANAKKDMVFMQFYAILR